MIGNRHTVCRIQNPAQDIVREKEHKHQEDTKYNMTQMESQDITYRWCYPKQR